jgi:phage terminase small subunit
MADGLNDRQEKFCQEYMIDFNGTQAAIRAGYSADSAAVIATENLTKPNIQTRLSELKKEAAEQFGISKQQLINELKKIAFFDIRKIYTDDNGLKNVRDFDDDSAGAVAGIEVDEIDEFVLGRKTTIGSTKKVKLHSKIAAIERVSKMLGYDEPIKNETKITGVTVNYNPQPGNEPLPE